VPSRRAVLLAAALGAAAGGAAGCAAPFSPVRLRLATGGTAGEYYRLGQALAAVWQERLRLAAAPAVLATDGSPANLSLLLTGAAEVAVSQVDVAADRMAGGSPLRALAAVYNDAVQIVVAAGSPVRAVGDLRGARVAVGRESSGVSYVAQRVLEAAGLADAVQRVRLDLAGSVAALRAGEVDAFFWVGALPTTTVGLLAAEVPLRLLDLDPVLDAVRARHPVYTPGTVPAGTYGLADPVVTLQVRNLLLVTDDLDADLVAALTGAVFGDRQRLADATPAARTVDVRSAILTGPIPLHDGALRWYAEDATA
jgi:uncharacterized protein